MDKNKQEASQRKSKLAFRLDLLIIGIAIIIISYVLPSFPPNISQEFPIVSKYYEGMWLLCTGIVGLLGWALLIIWIFLYIRHRRQPTQLAHCPKCGSIPKSNDDRFCRKCGTELAV